MKFHQYPVTKAVALENRRNDILGVPIIITVPINTRYITFDFNGTVKAWNTEDKPICEDGWWLQHDCQCHGITVGEVEGAGCDLIELVNKG